MVNGELILCSVRSEEFSELVEIYKLLVTQVAMLLCDCQLWPRQLNPDALVSTDNTKKKTNSEDRFLLKIVIRRSSYGTYH